MEVRSTLRPLLVRAIVFFAIVPTGEECFWSERDASTIDLEKEDLTHDSAAT